MRLFLDTNIVIDYLTARGDVTATDQIFESIDEGIHTGVISIGSYYTITYCVERFLKEEGYKNPRRLVKLRDVLTELLLSLEVAGHTREDLLSATNDPQFKDLEDSYQLRAASAASCAYLITNNVKDFRDSDSTEVTVVTPKMFLKVVGSH